MYIYIYVCVYIYYYTPLPLNLANRQQATSNKQQVTSKQATSKQHFSFLFWLLLRSTASGSTLL